MRKGNYSYESYLGVKYFKSKSFYLVKCRNGARHDAFRCYIPTSDGNYLEFRTLTNCLAYIKAMTEIEKAKSKLEALVV